MTPEAQSGNIGLRAWQLARGACYLDIITGVEMHRLICYIPTYLHNNHELDIHSKISFVDRSWLDNSITVLLVVNPSLPRIPSDLHWTCRLVPDTASIAYPY